MSPSESPSVGNVVLFAVDAGGSGTRVRIAPPNSAEVSHLFDTINPSSTDRDRSERVLDDIVDFLGSVVAAAGRGAGEVRGTFASAAVTPGSVDAVAALVADALRARSLWGRVVVTNDAVPLLLAPPVRGHGAVLVCGTGSVVLAGTGDGPAVRVGGHEYIGSDQGSGYAIGRYGLMRAVREVDGGRGPSALRARIEDHHGCSVVELARSLAETPFPKRDVAALAPLVIAAWAQDGDEAATAVLDTAFDELRELVACARDRVGGDLERWALIGGLLLGFPPFLERVRSILVQVNGPRVVAEPHENCLTAGLRLAADGFRPLADLPLRQLDVAAP